MDLKISELTAGAPALSGDVVPIARSGANFGLQLADILGLSVLRGAAALLSEADVLALTSTSGVELVAAKAGHLYIPVVFQIQKSAGPAFGTASAATIAVGHLGSGFYINMTHAGLTDQTILTTKYRTGAAIAAGGDSSAAYENKALGVMTSTGTFNGTGSPVRARVLYYDIEIP